MPELDGPEMLQFAMMFVQGALKKSQVCDIKHRFVVSDFVDTTFACLVVAKNVDIITDFVRNMTSW